MNCVFYIFFVLMQSQFVIEYNCYHNQEPYTLKMNPVVPDWQYLPLFTFIYVTFIISERWYDGWEEVDTDVWKNFIPVVFFKLVSL